jgi:hypothetical protein
VAADHAVCRRAGSPRGGSALRCTRDRGIPVLLAEGWLGLTPAVARMIGAPAGVVPVGIMAVEVVVDVRREAIRL